MFNSQKLHTWMVSLDSSSRFIIRPSTANTHCLLSGLLPSEHSSCEQSRAGKSAPRARTGPSSALWGSFRWERSPGRSRAKDTFVTQIHVFGTRSCPLRTCDVWAGTKIPSHPLDPSVFEGWVHTTASPWKGPLLRGTAEDGLLWDLHPRSQTE